MFLNLLVWVAGVLSLCWCVFNPDAVVYVQYAVGYFWCSSIFLLLFLTNYYGTKQAAGYKGTRLLKFLPFIAMALKYSFLLAAGWAIIANKIDTNLLHRYFLGAVASFALFISVNSLLERLRRAGN